MSARIAAPTSQPISSARRAMSLAVVTCLFRPAPGETFAPRSRQQRATPTLLTMLADWFSPAGHHCHRASCRRRTYCALSDVTGLPRCIGECPDAVFEEYVRMFDLVTHFAERIRPGTLATWHGQFDPGPFGLRQFYCIAILEMALPDDHPLWREFVAFWAHEWPRRRDGAGPDADPDAGPDADPDAGQDSDPGAGIDVGPSLHEDTPHAAAAATRRPMPGPECF